jgi:dihydrofolate reductase
MGTIIITTNMSLDGVVEDPDGQEGFALGGWFGAFGGADLEAWTKLETEEALGADALLLGRRSDEWFATRWQTRTGVWADKLNGMPKYVVTATGNNAKWSNSTVVGGDVIGEIAKLKEQISGEILVYASYQLVHALLEHDLVDELRLVVFPVVLGAGKRLFGETSNQKPLRLAHVTTIGDGLALMTYQPLRASD